MNDWNDDLDDVQDFLAMADKKLGKVREQFANSGSPELLLAKTDISKLMFDLSNIGSEISLLPAWEPTL